MLKKSLESQWAGLMDGIDPFFSYQSRTCRRGVISSILSSLLQPLPTHAAVSPCGPGHDLLREMAAKREECRKMRGVHGVVGYWQISLEDNTFLYPYVLV